MTEIFPKEIDEIAGRVSVDPLQSTSLAKTGAYNTKALQWIVPRHNMRRREASVEKFVAMGC